MEQVIVHTHLHKYDFMSISRSIYYYMQLISTILGETVHLLLYSLNSCLLEITISMSIIFIETGFFIKKKYSPLFCFIFFIFYSSTLYEKRINNRENLHHAFPSGLKVRSGNTEITSKIKENFNPQLKTVTVIKEWARCT